MDGSSINTRRASPGRSVLVEFLRFQVQLTREVTIGTTRGLSVYENKKPGNPWWNQFWETGISNNYDNEHRLDLADEGSDVDKEFLTSLLQVYLDEYFRVQFSESKDRGILYAPFSQVVINLEEDRRHLLDQREPFGNLFLDQDDATEGATELDYELNFGLGIDTDFNVMDPSQEIMDMTSVPQHNDNINRYLRSKPKIGIESGSKATRKTGFESSSTTTVTSESRTLAETSTAMTSMNFGGVAIFLRDGDLPIPNSNTVQSMQLQAFADEDGTLLTRLQSSPPSTGLNTIISVSASVLTTQGEPIVKETNGNSGNGLDVIILVAIVVAAISMLLLGLALYLAFKRRQNYNNHLNHMRLGSYQSKNRNHHKNSQYDVNDPNKLRKSSKETDDTNNSGRPPTPPIIEMMDNHNDDAISDYTESVYSVAVGNGLSQGGSINPASEWPMYKVTRKLRADSNISSVGINSTTDAANTNNYNPANDDNETDKDNTINDIRDSELPQTKASKLEPLKHVRASSRFSPRYIVSSIRNSNSNGHNTNSNNCSTEMEGVPPLSSTMQNELARQQLAANIDTNQHIIDGNNETDVSLDSTNDKNTGQSATGLYPEHVIDDDINSSLSAYAQGLGISNHYNSSKKNGNTGGVGDDGASLSSMESYGFSLDGIGDYSTVGTSTKYGY